VSLSRNIAGVGVGTLAALVVAVSASAQAITDPTAPAPPPSSAPAPAPAATSSKPTQAPSPFTFTAAYTADLLDDVDGGRRSGAGYVGLIKLSAAYDGTTSGHQGLTGLASVEDSNGSAFSANKVGGFQSVVASEAQPRALRLYEVWLQQDLLQSRGGVKAGLVDINTTFDVQQTAALFLNASHGIGSDISDTGLNGPSDYPTPALAITTFYRPAKGWTAQLGVFDGVAGDPAHRADFVAVKLDGALIIGQIEKRFEDVARVEVGAWSYTSAFPSLDQFNADGKVRDVRGNDGVYGLAEGRLMAKPGGGDGGLSGWIRVGLANGDINEVANYLGAGLVYTGLIKDRDKDQAGVAIARAGFGAGARYAGALVGKDIGGSETDLETTYRYVFKDWLNIQPDLQYVIDLHGDRHVRNALVAGLRLAFTYSK
jgi:porin